MNIKYCVSLKLAKQMKKLGFPQETEFQWGNTIGQEDQTCWKIWKKHDDTTMKWIAAPHVGELGEWLPWLITVPGEYFGDNEGECFYLELDKGAHGWVYYYSNWEDDLNRDRDGRESTEANARAKMLIYLAKNNLIDPKKL